MKNKISKLFTGSLLFLFFLSLSLLVINQARAQWTPTSGVSGGNIWCMTTNTAGNTLFAGTFGYGIFKSADNGVSWTPADSGIKGTYGTYILSLIPSGSNIIAGTVGGIFYSSNNGVSWNVADTILVKNKAVYALSTLGTTGNVIA